MCIDTMSKIVILIPFFGRLPKIFSAFLDSCRLNPSIDFILFTDDDITSYDFPRNFRVVDSSLRLVRSLCPEEVRNGLRIPYKLCDYKPLYGEIFADYIKGYDFWGYCDIDFLFGKIEAFIRGINLDDYDRLFDLGHLTIYRNTPKINRLWRVKYRGQHYIDSINYVFNTTLSCNFDECHMNKTCEEILGNRWLRGKLPYIDVDWRYPFFRCGDISIPQLFVHYPDGRLYRMTKSQDRIVREEFYYIHMIRRSFFEINPEIIANRIPYLITHIGFLPFDETHIDEFFDIFSLASQEEILERSHSFDFSLRESKKKKIRHELQCMGWIKGGSNILLKLLYDHILCHN